MASAPLAAPAPASVPLKVGRGRLFRKYLLLILSLVMIALLASSAISIYFTYQETKSALASLQHEKAIGAASRIEQYIHQIEQQLAYAALPQLDANDRELRRIEFLKLLRQAPEVTDISQLDAEGREQIAVSRLGMDNLGSLKDRSDEPAFRNAKKGQPWFGPVYFRKETEPYMTIAIRPSDKGAVTIAEVNLKFIWDVVSRIKIGDKGLAYVVDGNGFLIAHPDIGLVLRKTQMSELPHVKAAMNAARSDDAEPAMVSIDLTGTSVLASVAPIPPLRWYVFVEQPVSEVYARLNASIVRTVLLLLAGMIISAIGALALARGMVRPIRTLEEGAQRIGAGELDQKIEIHTGDELEALANRFNVMSTQLRESYAGLERKVEERTSELKNSLQQQTAISEILRVISSSPTDVRPVLEAVAERAALLCDAPYARILLVAGDELVPVADYSVGGEPLAKPSKPIPTSRSTLTGRTVTDRKTIHIADVVPLLDSEFVASRESNLKLGSRTVLSVPLMREGGAYGAIFLFRRDVRMFSPDQVALVETFARQAAIAIDNVRLFNETKETLDQQTAISEILRVIAGSPGDVQPMLDAVAERALKLCDAAQSTILLVEGDALRVAAGLGSTRALEAGEIFPLNRGSLSGRAVVDGESIHVEDLALASEDEFPVGRDMQRRVGHHTALSVPLMREDRAIGAIALWRLEVRQFTDKQIALVKTFADQAAIAIENVRLFNETREALEQQTAVAEILRVISSSPTDVLPVLDAIAERAARLCDAASASMYLIEGDHLRHLASKGPSPDPVATVEAIPINRESVSGRALLERHAIQVHDMLDEGAEYPLSYELAQQYGHRTVAVMPLYREGQPFGTILLRRNEVRSFNDRELALLQTFGDQAAIAIENVRLFNETREALEQQRASGEVLAAISSSIADTSPVFDKILESCERLFAGKYARYQPGGRRRPDPPARLPRPRSRRPAPYFPLAFERGKRDGGRYRESRRGALSRCRPWRGSSGEDPSRMQRGGLQGRHLCADGVGRQRDRGHLRRPRLCRAVLGEGYRIAQDLRRSGSDRNPEFALVQRDPGKEPATRSRQQAQVRIPGQHVTRAAHAAQRDHRLFRGVARAPVRRSQPQAGGLPQGHLQLGQAPADADQRHTRLVQGRGRTHGARAVNLRHRFRHLQRDDAGARARAEPRYLTGPAGRCYARGDHRRRAQIQADPAQPADQRCQVHA